MPNRVFVEVRANKKFRPCFTSQRRCVGDCWIGLSGMRNCFWMILFLSKFTINIRHWISQKLQSSRPNYDFSRIQGANSSRKNVQAVSYFFLLNSVMLIVYYVQSLYMDFSFYLQILWNENFIPVKKVYGLWDTNNGLQHHFVKYKYTHSVCGLMHSLIVLWIIEEGSKACS